MDHFIQAKKGSRRAFKSLIKEYGPGFYGCFFRITQSEQRARDLYKSMWLRFYAEIKTMAPPSPLRLLEVAIKLIEDGQSHRSPYGQEVNQYLNASHIELKRIQHLNQGEQEDYLDKAFSREGHEDHMGHGLFSPLPVPVGLNEEIVPFIKSRKKFLAIGMIIVGLIAYTAMSWDAMPFADDIENFLTENPLVPEKDNYEFEVEVSPGLVDENRLQINFKFVTEVIPEDMTIKARLTKFSAPANVVPDSEGYAVVFDLSEVEMKTKQVELNLDFILDGRVIDTYWEEVRVKDKPFEEMTIALDEEFIAEGVIITFKELKISQHRTTLSYTVDNEEDYMTSFIFFDMTDDLGNNYFGGGGSGYNNSYELYFDTVINPKASSLTIQDNHANHFKITPLTLVDGQGTFEYQDRLFRITQVTRQDIPEESNDIISFGRTFYKVETDEAVKADEVPRLFFHDGLQWSYMQTGGLNHTALVTVDDFKAAYGNIDARDIDDYQKMVDYYEDTYGKILNIHHLQYEMEQMEAFKACEITIQEQVVGNEFYFATFRSNNDVEEIIGCVYTDLESPLNIKLEIPLTPKIKKSIE